MPRKKGTPRTPLLKKKTSKRSDSVETDRLLSNRDDFDLDSFGSDDLDAIDVDTFDRDNLDDSDLLPANSSVDSLPQLSADETRRQLGLPTESEELAAQIAAEDRIVAIEDALAEMFRTEPGEFVPITEEDWQRREALEDELSDKKYEVQLAKDRRQLSRVDDALSSGRLDDSTFTLLTAMREQFLNLILIAANLRQVELNRRALRDMDDADGRDDDIEYEEVRQADGQIILRRTGLGKAIDREPVFILPSAGPSSFAQGNVQLSPTARGRLENRIRTGLLPAAQVHTDQPLSGDDRVRTMVSLNRIMPGDSPTDAARFLGGYTAGGAIPIAIEQLGDKGVDTTVLSRRAMNAAVLVIDPKRLSKEAKESLEIIRGSGEFMLPAIPSGAIVAVIAPAHGLEGIDTIGRRNVPILKVATINQDVAFNYDGRRENVRIEHPDYESGFRQILQSNPGKNLLFHTTRLGDKNPIAAASSTDSGDDESDLL